MSLLLEFPLIFYLKSNDSAAEILFSAAKKKSRLPLLRAPSLESRDTQSGQAPLLLAASGTMSRPTVEEAVEVLMMNEPKAFRIVTEVLFKIVRNIELHPHEPKYSQISTGSAAYTGKIACAKGGLRFLRAVGFEKREAAAGGAGCSSDAGDAPTLVLAAPDAEVLEAGKQALKAAVKEFGAKVEAARAAENKAAAFKLAELKRVSAQNNSKRDATAEAERRQIMEGMAADKAELERQRDPSNFC